MEETYQYNPLEELTNKYWRLQRLLEEGHPVMPLMDDVWLEIANIIHEEKHDPTPQNHVVVFARRVI